MKTSPEKKVAKVVNKQEFKRADEHTYDLDYWRSQPIRKRAEAITFIISQSLRKGERLDKSIVKKGKLKP